MAFVDELTIEAKAGDGGNGIVSWRQEKYRPLGGPAGGNGGNGGDLYVRAIRDLMVLANYRGNPKFSAERGGDGRRNSSEGARGEDFYIDLPIGSIVTNKETGESFQLLAEGETKKILRGGRGGLGNEHFKSSHNTTPEEQTDGTKGGEAEFYIELQLLVDLGMVGLPSAGKSSLVNALTNSRIKTAEYHFTTLEPGLGMFDGYVLADIPGLIRGAAQGKGLGHKFLRHIKRTRAIAHLVSFENHESLSGVVDGMQKAYEDIRAELTEYADELAEKPELIVLSKSDMVSPHIAETERIRFEKETGKQVVVLSVIDDEQMKAFSRTLSNYLARHSAQNNDTTEASNK